MALLVRGRTHCPLCGRIIAAGDPVVSFPPLISNQLDPLFMFNDASFHRWCFDQHPLKAKIENVYQGYLSLCGPGKYKCIVCGEKIMNPDDYVCLGYFTNDPTHPLHRFNYMQFHRFCIAKWSDVADFRKILGRVIRSGEWKGLAVDRLLAILDAETGK